MISGNPGLHITVSEISRDVACYINEKKYNINATDMDALYSNETHIHMAFNVSL